MFEDSGMETLFKSFTSKTTANKPSSVYTDEVLQALASKQLKLRQLVDDKLEKALSAENYNLTLVTNLLEVRKQLL